MSKKRRDLRMRPLGCRYGEQEEISIRFRTLRMDDAEDQPQSRRGDGKRVDLFTSKAVKTLRLFE